MKKFTFSLLLGSSLLFGIHHTYAEETIATEQISAAALESDSKRKDMHDQLRHLFSKLYLGSITGATIVIPQPPANTNFKGIIEIKKDNQSWPIDYQISSYNNLSDLNKKLFDHFNFDKNQFVTIIGLNGTYNDGGPNGSLRPKDGSLTVDQRTVPLGWVKLPRISYQSHNSYRLNSCSHFKWKETKGFYWQE